MANTAEGITVGDEDGLDPNDPHDFAAIMEGRGVAKTDEDTTSPDTSIASGLTYAAEPGQPAATPERDEKGRFVSNQERTAAASDTGAAAATDTSGTDGAVADPEIEAFLAKYDGDVEKALKGAANAQSLIGRRDEDKERLERELAELKGRLDGFIAAGGATRQAAPVLSDDQIEEVATQRIETLGYSNAATEAANIAHTQGDERAYRTILSQWMLEDPAGAMDFNTDFRLWQREQKAAATQPEAPAWLARVEEQAKVEQYGASLKGLQGELGESFPLVAQHLDAALEQMPQNVLAMIDSEDAEARDAGFRIVADRALRLAAAAGAAAPAANEPAAAAAQAVQRKLAGARVASGALRPAEKKPDAPANREDAIKEFKRQIVEAPTTSIASGLTYGPQV